MFTKRNFYHPFLNKSLGFFLASKDGKYADQKLSKKMNLRQWLNMWGRLTYGSAGISDFPIWVQLLPEVFFKVIDRDEDGLLAFEEVKHWYKDLIGITNPATLDKVCREGYRAMTAVSNIFL